MERAAQLSGFSSVVEELPRQWDTVLSRELPGGAELSGGQWQRLALARALFATFHGARILVLDEPTAALDVRAEARFYERFHEITAGLTTLVISHRFATVRRAQRIYVLDGGVITEQRQPRRAGRGRRHVRRDVPAAGREVRAVTAVTDTEAAAPPGGAEPSGGKRPSPRRLARLATILFFDGFRAAPGWMALVTAMLVLGSVAGTCYPLGYKLLADGALAGNAGETGRGRRGRRGPARPGLGADRHRRDRGDGAVRPDRRLPHQADDRADQRRADARAPGAARLPRPGRAAQLGPPPARRPRPGRSSATSRSAARIIALLVLLGSVSPWLLLLPVTAVPPLVADRLAKKITKQSEDAMAADRRLAGLIFDLSAAAVGRRRAPLLRPRARA